MKVSDVLTVEIVDSGMEGEGIAKVDGYVLFVPMALKGETVQIRIDHLKKNFGYATLKKVEIPSDKRVRPACPVYGVCGGCDMQHVAYDEQKEQKRRQIETCLRKNAGIEFSVPEVYGGSNRFAYRNKLQMPFGQKDGKAVLGFFKEGTHTVVPTARCVLHGKWAEDLMKAVLSWANENKVSVYDERSQKGILRHLVARNVGGQIVIVIVGNGNKLPAADNLISALKSVFGDGFKLYFSPNRKNTNVILGESVTEIYGKNVKANVGGVRVDVSPYTFLQVNDEVRDMIYSAVAAEVENGVDVVIDAYSGMGIMTALLSSKAKEVYGVEIVPEAVSDADKLMAENGIKNVKNIAGDAAEVLPKLAKSLSETKADYVYHLAQSPFEAIKSGRKTFELRLYDEKRRSLKVGDVIEFYTDGTDERLLKKVKNLFVFDDFSALFKTLGTGENTCGAVMTEDAAVLGMGKYYSEERQQRNKVVAIELAPAEKRITVVLDPPRKGCDQKTLAAVKEARPEKVIYVSCNPATLARDLAILKTDFDLVSVRAYDMFPQTKHVETLVVLSHKKPDGHISVNVEFGEEEGQVSLKDIEKRALERAHGNDEAIGRCIL